MNLAVIPMLIAALLMVSSDAHVDTARLMMTGDHVIERHDGALIWRKPRSRSRSGRKSLGRYT